MAVLRFSLFVSGALFVGCALAQPDDGARMHQQSREAQGRVSEAQAERGQQRLYRSSRIIGSSVRDLQGRRLGEIHDLVLGSRRGEIAYAVVSFGGVMGVGKTFHAVPWASLQPHESGRYYALNADRNTVRNAPGFDLARWPDLADQRWRDEVDGYWARTVGQAVGAGNEALSGPLNAGAAGSVEAVQPEQTEGR